MKKRFLRLLPVFAAFLLFAGGAYALNEHNLATLLGVSAGDTEALNYEGTVKVNSAYIGDQDDGGVTFFNGTIINTTTDADGNGIPVTFGDDVRIDGKISRLPGEDAKPVQVDDDLDVDGDVTADNLYTKTEADAAFSGVSATATEYHNIPSTAFTAYDETYQWNHVGFTTGPYLYTDSGRYYVAPVNLPNGAVVTNLAATVFDNHAQALTTTLENGDIADGTAAAANQTTMASAATASNAATWQVVSDSSITDGTVDNLTKTYWVTADFGTGTGTNLTLRNVQLTYTQTNPF